MNEKIAFFWFRRDLRLEDNAGLYHALKSGHPVQCVFIFDKNILDKLEDKNDRRVVFIHQQLTYLAKELKKHGSSLITSYDTPENAWQQWITENNTAAVYTNHDYEPYAIARDESVKKLLLKNKISFHTYKDQVIFEKDEVIKDNGEPYTVFTPYKNKYRAKLNSFYLTAYPTENYFQNFRPSGDEKLISLEEMGFRNENSTFPSSTIPYTKLQQYADKRNFPALDATTHISVHLRFGTVSIRALAFKANSLLAETWFNELIWRDFYQMILSNFPSVVVEPFKSAYKKIPWRNNEEEFIKWCEGNTGYPIVDAGMRELNTTGFMHNRVRMITASFLTKHLLIDYRWGESYFAKKLIDFDLASNNGGWQWAAGCGTDSAPYFRIFNPTEQVKKFDPEFKYVRKWVPEFEDFSYPKPIVDHQFARERCLRVFKEALNS